MNAATPPRLRYMPMVEAMTCPGDAEAKDMRCSILLMRDRASQTLRHCCPEAGEVLRVVERLATEFAFSVATTAQLKQARHSMLQLVMAASGFEGLHASG